MLIHTPPDFRFPAAVVSHGWYQLSPFSWDKAAATLSRTETIGGETFDLRITHKGDRLVARSAQSLKGVESILQERLARMFQLQLDLGNFHRLCRGRASHKQISRAKFGRLLCGSTRFEDAVKIIGTTNTTWKQTVRMIDLLVENYGAKSRSGRRAFPTPGAIAAADPDDMQQLCRLGYRAAYIHKLAGMLENGSLDLESRTLNELTTDELSRFFRTLPGIGPYGSAHLLAMEGRHDQIAVDTEFRRFVREQHFSGEAVHDSELVAHYAAWGNWQYLAYWSELWMDIRATVEASSQASSAD